MSDSQPPPHTDKSNLANEPALHLTARLGDHAAIEQLVAGRVDPNLVFDNQTPLMVAAASADGASADTLRLLMKLGADPAIVLNDRSAATWASFDWSDPMGGDAPRLSVLLDAGAPLLVDDKTARRLVPNVAARGDANLLRLLLDAGASPNAVWDPAIGAASARWLREDMEEFARNNPNLADEMITPEVRKEMNAREDEEEQRYASAPWGHEIPLFMAVESNSIECVRLLLERGADPLVRNNSNDSALSLAQTPEITALLQKHGLRLDDRNYLDWSPLRAAVCDGEFGLDRVRALIASGADVNETYDRGFTIFMSAAGAMDRSVEVLRLLVEAGADPHAVTELGWNAFHAAIDVNGEANAEQSVRDILGYLKELGVNIEQVNRRGETPLAKAVFLGRGVEVRVLCELGADPNQLGSSHWCAGECGGTAQPLLSYVARWQIDGDEKAEALLAAGANPLTPDGDGHLPLARAVARLCAGAADYAAEFDAFYSGLPQTKTQSVAVNDRDVFVRSLRTILRPYIESFAARHAGSVTSGVGHRQEDRDELLNVIESMAAYEAWARRAQARQ